MEDREKELSDLCVGKPLKSLQEASDWNYFSTEGESLDEYWSSRDSFEIGVSVCGKKSFAAFVGIDPEKDEEGQLGLEYDKFNSLVMLFVGDSYEEVKKKVGAIS